MYARGIAFLLALGNLDGVATGAVGRRGAGGLGQVGSWANGRPGLPGQLWGPGCPGSLSRFPCPPGVGPSRCTARRGHHLSDQEQLSLAPALYTVLGNVKQITSRPALHPRRAPRVPGGEQNSFSVEPALLPPSRSPPQPCKSLCCTPGMVLSQGL